MVSPALAAVGKIALEQGSKLLLQYIQGGDDNSAEVQTQRIVDAVNSAKDEIIKEIRSVVTENEFNTCTTRIESWMKQLKDGYRLKSAGNHEQGDKQLTTLKLALQSSNNDIVFTMTSMHNLLTKEDAAGGLIKQACAKLNPALRDAGRPGCDMYWYMLTLDRFLASAMQWQLAALALQLFAMVDGKIKVDADHYRKDLEKQFDLQTKRAYQCYHPLIKVLKASYWDSMVPNKRWEIRRQDNHDYFAWANENNMVTDTGSHGARGHICYQWEFMGQTHPFDTPASTGATEAYWATLHCPAMSNGGGELWSYYHQPGDGNPYGFYSWALFQGDLSGAQWTRVDVKLLPVDDEHPWFKMLLRRGYNFSNTPHNPVDNVFYLQD